MSNIKLFESKKVRTQWDEKTQQWYFSVIDVIEILTDSKLPKRYWSDLKTKLKAEGSEVYEKIVRLKMLAEDGKMRETDVADTKALLRIIQSIPSPKAEPFKQWLAKVGYERMSEIANPEESIERARENWQKLGRSEKWIQLRFASSNPLVCFGFLAPSFAVESTFRSCRTSASSHGPVLYFLLGWQFHSSFRNPPLPATV